MLHWPTDAVGKPSRRSPRTLETEPVPIGALPTAVRGFAVLALLMGLPALCCAATVTVKLTVVLARP